MEAEEVVPRLRGAVVVRVWELDGGCRRRVSLLSSRHIGLVL